MSSQTDKSTSLRIAAVQMDANPVPTSDRLERAERLVLGAAESGAQLVVLPECFNTGYTFNEKNHTRVEKIDGQTATWLRDTAAELNIYLGGSFMLSCQKTKPSWFRQISSTPIRAMIMFPQSST